MPTGIIKLATEICALYGIPPAVALSMVTDNTARAYGLSRGVIKPGKEADLLVMDAPPGSQGKTALEAMELCD